MPEVFFRVTVPRAQQPDADTHRVTASMVTEGYITASAATGTVTLVEPYDSLSTLPAQPSESQATHHCEPSL